MSDRVRYLRNIFDNICLQERYLDGIERLYPSGVSNGAHAQASEAGRRHG